MSMIRAIPMHTGMVTHMNMRTGTRQGIRRIIPEMDRRLQGPMCMESTGTITSTARKKNAP